MDEKLFKQIYGGAIKNISTMEELDKAEEERRLREEMEQAEREQAQENQKKQAEEEKPWQDKAGEWLGNAAKAIGAGVQQTGAKVADVALKGGALLDEAALIGKSEEDADKQRQLNIAKTEQLRQGIKSGKDIQGENFEGSKDIGVEDIQEDPKKLLELAGEGLDVGLGATMLANPVGSAAKGLAKETAETGLKIGAEQAARLTTKEAAKDIGKEAALFGGLDAAAEGSTTYGETGDLEEALKQGAQAGITSGVLQGGLGLAGHAAGDAISGIRNPEAPAPKAPDTKQVDEVVDSLNRPLGDVPEEELRKNLDDILDGKSRTGNIEEDYKQVQAITDELNDREATKYFADGGKNVEDAKKELEAFDAGEMPDTAYRPREANIESAPQVFADPDIPVEIRSAAQEVMDDQGKIDTMLDTLMNDKRYEQSHADMDAAYHKRSEEISQMPGPRQIIEQEKLDMQYQDDLAELEMMREKDMPDVEEYNMIAEKLKAREEQLVGDVNMLIEQNPDKFRTADEAEVQAQRSKLESQVADAERFTDRKRVIDTNGRSADPVKGVENKPEVREAVTNELVDEIDKIPSQFKSKDQSLLVMKAMSPSQWMEKRGLRGGEDGAGENVHANIVKGLTAANKANLEDTKVIAEIKKILPGNKEAQAQIVDYIEGKRSTLTAMGDTKAAEQIKGLLDEKKAEIEKMGFATREDYFPHIWDKADPKVQERFADNATGEISFGNIKQRLENAEDYSTDIVDVLSQYVNGINRKVHLEPALKPLSDLKTQVKMTEAEGKYIDLYINQLKGLNKSDLQRGVNKGIDKMYDKMGITKGKVGTDHYAQMLSTQRMISAVSAMGLNPGTILRNVTQGVNTVADLGPKYSAIGSIDGTRMLASKEGIEELKRTGVIDGGVSQNFTDLLEDATVKGKLSSAKDKAVWGMMAGIRGTDIMLRAQAYAGAKALAKSKGLTGEAAENFAINKVVDTQFMTSVADMPISFSGQGVRSLTQLATFSGKQAGFLKRMGIKMVKGEDGKGFNIKDSGQVVAGMATAALATEMLKPLIGFNEKEWVPFYDQVAPFLAPITGDDSSSGESVYRSPLVRLLMGDGKSKDGILQAINSIGKEDKEGNKTDVGAAASKFWEDNWANIVPAGTQIKKTTEGLQTTEEGYARNKKGNIKYKQDQSGDSNVNSIMGLGIDPSLQAGLFGQYSTKAGRQWIDEGFPTLSTKQTQQIDKLKSEESKQQYMDFYKAKSEAPGRQKAYDAIKDAAKAGNANRASQLAEEYNSTVKDAMAGYYAQHDNLPAELRDELTSKLYINVNKAIDSALKTKK